MICCLCVDADWAHPQVAAYALDWLKEAGTPFTFFATSDQESPDNDLAEVAWHPNFQRGEARENLALLARRFPGARGVRPHRLDWGTCDARLLREFGVAWTSSLYRPNEYVPRLEQGLVEASISWGDNWWFLKQLEPDWETMRSDAPGLYVLNTHPIHIYLNTTSLSQYEAAKQVYRDPAALRGLRSATGRGVADVFRDIVSQASMTPARFLTLSEALTQTGWRDQGAHNFTKQGTSVL